MLIGAMVGNDVEEDHEIASMAGLEERLEGLKIAEPVIDTDVICDVISVILCGEGYIGLIQIPSTPSDVM